MTIIEGVGDEVIHFFILLAIIFIALVAWWSTNISERPLIRTVLILERRATRRTPTDTQTTPVVTTDASEITQETSEAETEQKSTPEDPEESNQIEVNVVEGCDNVLVNDEDLQNTISNLGFLSEENCTLSASDESEEASANENTTDESSVVRNRRLAFFENRQEQTDVQIQNQCLKDLISESTSSGEGESHPASEGNIRIRLKYLNDDQKLVEGRLQEQLGDFKKRHFSLELAGRKLVRLIFNGQVLQQDTRTLQNYGLFDNCVVHCLVHQPRTPPPSPNLNRPRNERQNQSESAQNWDLGNILFASLSLLLGLAWYGRYQYAQLYTATTTVALVGLTGIFTVSLIGMYMPDAEGVRTQ